MSNLGKPSLGCFCRAVMKVSELRDGKAYFVIDGPRTLSSLEVNQGDVHVRRGDGGGEGLVAVRDGHHLVGPEILQYSGKPL